MKIKATASFIFEVVKLAFLALIIVIPIRYFIFQPFVVKGASMEPNFHDGDYLIVDELSYRFREPQRGEVIVFKYPDDPSQRFIKRVIGLPGERVELKDNQVTIITKDGLTFILSEASYLEPSALGLLADNEIIILSNDEYFVMGDNRGHSFDSRKWGAVSEEEIIGRTIFRAWPFIDFGLLGAPQYQTATY